jgi:hypothetical protein
MPRPLLLALAVAFSMALAACTALRGTNTDVRGATPAPAAPAPARYLYVWAGDKDEKDSDFFAVVDVRRDSPTYAQVLTTVPVGMRGTLPHHMEYELPQPGRALFGNGHHGEAIFRFDFSDAGHPRLLGLADAAPPLRFPHDFVRLPNGNLLVGYLRSEGPSGVPGDTIVPGAAGGIVEMDDAGHVVRWRSAADSTLRYPMRPYAFAVLPDVDRFVVTSAPMMEDYTADAVQVWRLSDLTRLATLPVPPARLAGGRVLANGHELPFEPRVMPDGSVLLNTFGCGFYRVTAIATRPEIRNVYTIDPEGRVPAGRRTGCGVPVVAGKFWVMAVGRLNALVTLDVSDPEHPREVGRLLADSTFRPHWMAKDPGSDRIVVGAENGGEDRMLIALIDPATGALRWDESFRSADGALGVSFVRERWPHGATGEAIGHAALFRP